MPEIFISCGQLTPDEKTLGILVKTLVKAVPGFSAYFAETVHSLDGLSQNVLDALARCDGVIAFLHPRGRVVGTAGEDLGVRSSVWVNQELAVLAYRQRTEAMALPLLAFKDPSVQLEGAMTALIANPELLTSSEQVADRVSAWLSETNFGSGDSGVFQAKWQRLSLTAQKVAAALVSEGGDAVKESAVRRALQDTFRFEKNEADKVLREAKLEFISGGLVQAIKNIHSGDELTIHPTWKFQIRRATAEILAEARRS